MVTRNTTISHYSKGFTIVELAVVIVVIGILAAITIVSYRGMQDRAHDVATQSNVLTYAEGLDLYRLRHHSYPTPNTHENRSDTICIGTPPKSGGTSCGTLTIACTNGATASAESGYYSDKLNQLMTPYIGAAPPSVLTRPFDMVSKLGDCTYTGTYTGATYTAAQRMTIYEKADKTVAYLALLLATEGTTANVYHITYAASDGECLVEGSRLMTGIPGIDPGSCLYIEGDDRFIETRPY